jgi:hypothetical protein
MTKAWAGVNFTTHNRVLSSIQLEPVKDSTMYSKREVIALLKGRTIYSRDCSNCVYFKAVYAKHDGWCQQRKDLFWVDVFDFAKHCKEFELA